MMRRDRPRSAPYIAALLSVAQEHGILIWLAAGTFYEGWLRWSTADREASMAAMHKGMALLRSQQQGAFMPMFMTRLAETEAEAGHPDAVLASVDMNLRSLSRLDSVGICPNCTAFVEKCSELSSPQCGRRRGCFCSRDRHRPEPVRENVRITSRPQPPAAGATRASTRTPVI
jgi:hypothetical protein